MLSALELAAAALQRGGLEEAVGHATAALRELPDEPEPGYLLALALALLGRPHEAMAAARDCLARHLGFEPVLELIAHLEEFDSEGVAGDRGQTGWAVGSTVADRWQIFGSAEGGMGVVYFVRDREWDGMELAVKTLIAPRGHSPEVVARADQLFRRETQVWLDLSGHPHIVSGFYMLEVDGALRFFMEYVAGTSLAERLRAHGRLGVAEALDVAIQIAAAFEYVHGRGSLHRDLKPANCLVGEGGHLRVTDFGLGKSQMSAQIAVAGPGVDTHGFAAPGLNLSRSGAGTPIYMAPEQWGSLSAAGKPADVYAFGATLYECLVGEPPFGDDPASWRRIESALTPRVRSILQAGNPIPDLVLRLLHEEVVPLPPSSRGAAVPPELDQLILTCLAKQPEARPTFAAVRAELVGLHAHATGVSYPRPLPAGLEPTEIGENNRAISYATMGQLTRAAEILRDWLTRDPSSLYPFLNGRTLAVRAGREAPQVAAGQALAFVHGRHPGVATHDQQLAAYLKQLTPYALWHGQPLTMGALSQNGTTFATAC